MGDVARSFGLTFGALVDISGDGATAANFPDTLSLELLNPSEVDGRPFSFLEDVLENRRKPELE